MVIDAHQHFWKVERGDYGWLTPDSPLYRDFLPEDLQPLLQAAGVDRTVVVQAAPTVAETEFLLHLADAYPFIAGVVGWLDLDSPTFVHAYERLRRHPKFVGIRPMLQDLPELDWVLRPQVVDNLSYLAEQQFPVDILVYPVHLPYILRLLERIPHLRAVIDHLAKPCIRAGTLEPWREHIAAIARYDHVWCKLSGMVTEAHHANWKADDFRPYVEHVCACFGPKRLMFGSDWPVCTLAATYAQVVSLLQAVLPVQLSPDERAAIFGGNAAQFYRLAPLLGGE